ncbi:MAG: MFS transporter [Jiangellaceae bacterium]|nr:MFS transporter [Jiangellaceae bacterium]
MTQREEAAGKPAASTGAASPAVAASPPWAPLKQRAFRWLWLGMLISFIGAWMQVVGAQWLLVDAPNAATLVSLVQAANTLPVMLMALPAGVLADSFDRRRLLLAVQAYFFVVAILLAALTAAGHMTSALLVAFTFALGIGGAVLIPVWQSIIPELVPRTELRATARLDAVSVNVARAVGPVLAGVIITRLGVPTVFALTAVSVVFLAIALLFWRRQQALSQTRERFLPALRAGGRYVWHEPVVRRILVRAFLFVAPAMALWALLPVIANQHLGLEADGYGALFGAMGAGAVLGALVLGPVRIRLGTNGMLAAAGIVYALSLALIVLTASPVAALASLLFAGLAWTSVLSTLVGELQLFLPGWVRARSLAVLVIVFTGSMTVGSLVSGPVAELVGPRATLVIAAIVMVVGVVAGIFLRVPETGHLDPEPAIYWPEARLAFEPEPDTGPVVITVEYTVAPEREAAFLEAMDALQLSRRRTGATRWELYRDGERPNRFVEIFSVPSWEEHLRQHEGRLTATDQEIEETALAFSDPPARGEHLLPP